MGYTARLDVSREYVGACTGIRPVRRPRRPISVSDIPIVHLVYPPLGPRAALALSREPSTPSAEGHPPRLGNGVCSDISASIDHRQRERIEKRSVLNDHRTDYGRARSILSVLNDHRADYGRARSILSGSPLRITRDYARARSILVIEGPVQSCLLTHFQKDRTQDQDRTDHQS